MTKFNEMKVEELEQVAGGETQNNNNQIDNRVDGNNNELKNVNNLNSTVTNMNTVKSNNGTATGSKTVVMENPTGPVNINL